MTIKNWQLEQDVDDYMYQFLENIGLPKNDPVNGFMRESEISDFMKEALKGGAKTNSKANFGKPDITIEKYIHDFDLPIVFENKLNPNRFINEKANGELATTDKAIKEYAVNGAIHYARTILRNKKAKHVLAIAVAGNNPSQLKFGVYYVYAIQGQPKDMLAKYPVYKNLAFLRDYNSMKSFFNDATLTDQEKHKILIKNQAELIKKAKKLNKLMNNFNISVEQRVIYVSGMLLAMQEVTDYQTKAHIANGLTPDDLTGTQSKRQRDSQKIINQISDFLDARGNIPTSKRDLMMDSFKMSINMDADRDKLTQVNKEIAKYSDSNQASITKQIFIFLYEFIYKAIDENSGSLDIMGSMYSEFLKYALSDGASLGKVLTPPYVTNLMANALNVNMNDNVMDLATGSGAFLVSSMQRMIDQAKREYLGDAQKTKTKIEHIKHQQLLGIEYDAKMWTLAAANMILRGDGSSQIKKGDTFETDDLLYQQFKPTKLLLNPPFSYKENGMPFLAFGLKHMQPGGKAAIIIQDSAGSGKAVNTNREILAHNTMLASIKMPTDLFEPNAGVQTSIYIFQAGIPHDYDKTVKFIDFRNDGQKRTKRGIREIDHSAERYNDLILLLKAGLAAENNKKFHPELWNLKKQYVEDTISDKGDDWNFEQHYKVDTTPTEADFLQVVGDWLDFQISSVIKEGAK